MSQVSRSPGSPLLFLEFLICMKFRASLERPSTRAALSVFLFSFQELEDLASHDQSYIYMSFWKVAIFIFCEETGAVGEDVGGCRHCRSVCFQHTVMFKHTFHFLPFPFHLSDKSISALCDYLMTCVPSALPALEQGFAPCHQVRLTPCTHTHTGKVFFPSLQHSTPTATATPYRSLGNPLFISLHCTPSSLHAQGWVNPSGMPIAAFPQLAAPDPK